MILKTKIICKFFFYNDHRLCMFRRTYGRTRIEPKKKKNIYISRVPRKKNNDYRVSKKEKSLLQLSDK